MMQRAPDFADIRGNHEAVRALERAAAEHINVLLVGPPGSGKTMLAQRLVSILPPLSAKECEETAMIYWGAGIAPPAGRPFRAPHHTVSDAGLFGTVQRRTLDTWKPAHGAVALPACTYPGEFSLAHGGVLFLDDLVEFRRSTLQAIKKTMADGQVELYGTESGYVRVPARPIVVAAVNPCPCGWYLSAVRECRCPQSVLASYRHRLDEIRLLGFPLQVEVAPVALTAQANEPSAVIAVRVARRW